MQSFVCNQNVIHFLLFEFLAPGLHRASSDKGSNNEKEDGKQNVPNGRETKSAPGGNASGGGSEKQKKKGTKTPKSGKRSWYVHRQCDSTTWSDISQSLCRCKQAWKQHNRDNYHCSSWSIHCRSLHSTLKKSFGSFLVLTSLQFARRPVHLDF